MIKYPTFVCSPGSLLLSLGLLRCVERSIKGVVYVQSTTFTFCVRDLLLMFLDCPS